MLKNSKCVINICCYAPRHMYTHNAHPCFEWYIPSKSPFLREFLNVESGNINGGFSCIFGRFKVWICKIMAYEGWSIINWCMNGVHEWDWVHERFLCPRAAPSGINNRSCTQSHSWTPNWPNQFHHVLLAWLESWLVYCRICLILSVSVSVEKTIEGFHNTLLHRWTCNDHGGHVGYFSV